MISPVDARRRWFGLFFLLVAAGMLIWGLTLLKARLTGLGFVAYWLACLGSTALALLTALLDARTVRRRLREENRELFHRTVGRAGAEDESARQKRTTGR
jgi:membrane protein implicated in regulation of membrane protease activity